MKPNNFILNSDYLALAQTGKEEFTAYFLAETFSPGQSYDRTQDFTVPTSQGSIDNYMISLNGSEFRAGSLWVISRSSPFLTIYVYRHNPSTIRVLLHEFTNQAGGYSMPMQTVKIKVASFRPPNIF